MLRRSVASIGLIVALVALLGACGAPYAADQGAAGLLAARAVGTGMVRVSAILDGPLTDARLAELSALGKVSDAVLELDSVVVSGKGLTPEALRTLPFVLDANFDAPRDAGPVTPIADDSMVDGRSTWDLDAVDVTDYGRGRTIAYDGSGVYVAVIDTGLVDGWENYFPVQRIATQYGVAFNGGGGENGAISTPTNKWEHDQNSHGTHVTSSILGYNRGGVQINGVAPLATVIPVKVLNQNGSGWSSVVAAGIVYVAKLKAGPLAAFPVVINMSLGGPSLDVVEKAAVDYAISKGVIVVASAGNSGEAGMGYPGGYAPVISVAASGWTGEWTSRSFWLGDVPDPTSAADFYIADFSSRQHAGQDLDIAAPGSWILGPYQVNGQVSFYFLGGTSMASPHVAGAVALLCQKAPGLVQDQVETLLEATAIALPAGSRQVRGPNGVPSSVSWGADATGAGLLNVTGALAALP